MVTKKIGAKKDVWESSRNERKKFDFKSHWYKKYVDSSWEYFPKIWLKRSKRLSIRRDRDALSVQQKWSELFQLALCLAFSFEGSFIFSSSSRQGKWKPRAFLWLDPPFGRVDRGFRWGRGPIGEVSCRPFLNKEMCPFSSTQRVLSTLKPALCVDCISVFNFIQLFLADK